MANHIQAVRVANAPQTSEIAKEQQIARQGHSSKLISKDQVYKAKNQETYETQPPFIPLKKPHRNGNEQFTLQGFANAIAALYHSMESGVQDTNDKEVEYQGFSLNFGNIVQDAIKKQMGVEEKQETKLKEIAAKENDTAEEVVNWVVTGLGAVMLVASIVATIVTGGAAAETVVADVELMEVASEEFGQGAEDVASESSDLSGSESSSEIEDPSESESEEEIEIEDNNVEETESTQSEEEEETEEETKTSKSKTRQTLIKRAGSIAAGLVIGIPQMWQTVVQATLSKYYGELSDVQGSIGGANAKVGQYQQYDEYWKLAAQRMTSITSEMGKQLVDLTQLGADTTNAYEQIAVTFGTIA